MQLGSLNGSSHRQVWHGDDCTVFSRKCHLNRAIITEPKIFEAPAGFASTRIDPTLMGAYSRLYAEKLPLMQIQKRSAALRIGAFGKHAASHRAKKIFAGLV